MRLSAQAQDDYSRIIARRVGNNVGEIEIQRDECSAAPNSSANDGEMFSSSLNFTPRS
jgi:hypothetical protein